MRTSNLIMGDCEQCGDVRRSNVTEGIEHIRRIGERQKPRSQWAYKPSNGDVVGKSATPAERKALRRRYLQERPHDGKPDKFPK